MTLRRLAWRVAAVVAGAGLYLVVVGSVHPWAVVQGLLVAAGALAISRPQLEPVRAGSWRHIARVAVRSARDVVLGSWQVGLAAAGLRPLPRAEWVEVSVGKRPEANPAALALLETLSPGTYLVDHHEDRNVLLFHAFDAADSEELQRVLAAGVGGDAGEVEGRRRTEEAPGGGAE